MFLRRSLADATLSDLTHDPAFFSGALLYAASFATFLLSLRRFEVLTVFPLFTGLAYSTVTLAAALFLDEALSMSRLAGIGLIAAGAVLLLR